MDGEFDEGAGWAEIDCTIDGAVYVWYDAFSAAFGLARLGGARIGGGHFTLFLRGCMIDGSVL